MSHRVGKACARAPAADVNYYNILSSPSSNPALAMQLAIMFRLRANPERGVPPRAESHKTAGFPLHSVLITSTTSGEPHLPGLVRRICTTKRHRLWRVSSPLYYYSIFIQREISQRRCDYWVGGSRRALSSYLGVPAIFMTLRSFWTRSVCVSYLDR